MTKNNDALAKPASEPAGGGREALQKLDAKTLRGIIARWETRREYLNTNPSAYDAFIEREVAGIPERALSSSAAPAGEAVAWRCYDLCSDRFSVTDDKQQAEAHARRLGEMFVTPLYAHPAPAAVEMREALKMAERRFLDIAQGLTLNVKACAEAGAEEARAALAPATEGRKG